MAYENVPIVAFNRGILSPLGLARVDLKRTALSAETMVNWTPRVLGSMMLRAGLGYTAATLSNAKSITIPFIFSGTDTARLEVTNLFLRPLVSDVPITRVSVATAVTNGTFGGAGSWTDSDESGATSTIAANTLTLVGTGGSAAIREQVVTVAGGDQNKEHALRIIVTRGPVKLRVGSTSGADDYITETSLGTGTHSLAFTPTGNFYIRLFSTTIEQKTVTNCTVEGAGDMSLPAPWLTADLPSMRWVASADVTWVTCYGYQQRKIERRGTRSWSIVLYEPLDGPFRVQNTGVIQLTPTATTGDITLTASKALFKSTQVGALFKISSIGQVVDTSFTAENTFSNPIKVTGRGTERSFSIQRSGTFSATLTLQRSVGDIGAWVDVPSHTYTTVGTSNYQDGLNDQIIYYRVGVKTGDYTSGTMVTEISYENGSIDGIVKITAFTSSTSVSAAVVQQLGGTGASALWKEGEWSDYRGWPSEVQLHEGRLFFMGKTKVQGSLPDAYESFDESVIGDSGPINRSFGKGPVDKVMWTASLQRLLIGGEIAEWSVRSTSFDEPLTPANFNVRSPSSQGAANVAAVQVDGRALFVQKSGNKLYEMNYTGDGYSFDYQSANLSEIAPEVTAPGIVKIGVQRQPDTRIHCVLSDGTVAVLVSQPAEDVMCWLLFTTPFAGGLVEDVCVMPGTGEDTVYYTVKRTILGSTVRYHEKFSLETECVGGNLNKQADSFVTYTGAPSATITAAHLKGETCVLWADGVDVGTAVANSSTGVITLPGGITASNIVAGGTYTAQFKSSKLAYAAQQGTALAMKKRIDHLSIILNNTHYQGVKYGKDFSNLQALPLVNKGKTTAANTIYPTYDVAPFEFPGTWDTDSRLCLQASAPRPCTVLGAIVGMVTNG